MLPPESCVYVMYIFNVYIGLQSLKVFYIRNATYFLGGPAGDTVDANIKKVCKNVKKKKKKAKCYFAMLLFGQDLYNSVHQRDRYLVSLFWVFRDISCLSTFY